MSRGVSEKPAFLLVMRKTADEAATPFLGPSDCGVEDRRLTRLLQLAKLHLPAAVEDIDLRSPRGLERSLMLRLAGSDWVRSPTPSGATSSKSSRIVTAGAPPWSRASSPSTTGTTSSETPH